MLNQKGDFLLYIIFTIVLLLIGAILFYMYIAPATGSNTDNNQMTDSNFIEEFKAKIPTSQDKETFPNSYKIYAKLALDMKLELYEKSLDISGKPTIIVSERKFNLENPILNAFSGYIDKTGIYGGISTIKLDNSELEINSYIKSTFDNINKIKIPDVYLDLEKANIVGKINVQDKEYNLNKVYLKMKAFNGTVTVMPDKEYVNVELDGNVGYLQIIDNQMITTLK